MIAAGQNKSNKTINTTRLYCLVSTCVKFFPLNNREEMREFKILQRIILRWTFQYYAQDVIPAKTYGIWICSNCGFFLTTRDTRAINTKKDIETGFNFGLRREIRQMREDYQKDRKWSLFVKDFQKLYFPTKSKVELVIKRNSWNKSLYKKVCDY